MHHIYQDILKAKANNKKLLAILLDPDKLSVSNIAQLCSKINSSPATHIFVGGSIVANGATELLVLKLKEYISLPIILFPGDVNQVTNTADGIYY